MKLHTLKKHSCDKCGLEKQLFYVGNKPDGSPIFWCWGCKSKLTLKANEGQVKENVNFAIKKKLLKQ